MKIEEILSLKESFGKYKDIEKNLLNRQVKGKIAGWGALLSAVAQVVILLFQDDIPGKIIQLFRNPATIDIRIFFPTLLVILAIVIYLLIRRTGFLMKETREPFRYTFWVEPFSLIEDTPAGRFTLQSGDRLKLLHHDLLELIHHRIRRFSILKEAPGEQEKKLTDTRLSSHIHVRGNYAIREDRENNEWIIHVMPFVRIGPEGEAETLAQTIRFPLTDDTPDSLDTEEYNQLLERVYSRITTEIYARIESDIRKKIDLFPTSYLQANALYAEADDMAGSNTINAFESAIILYQEAIRKIELTLTNVLSSYFLYIPLIRSFFIKYLHQYSRIQIGYAQCLIYKNRIASLSGRRSNTLFEIRHNLQKTITSLESYHNKVGSGKLLRKYTYDRKTFSILSYLSFPKDSLFRILLFKPGKKQFRETCSILFNAYVAHSLTDSLTGSYTMARRYLEKARAIAPDLSTSQVLFFLAEAYCEPDTEKALMLFQQATEIDPGFQIARYDLAYWMEMKFRANGEITTERAHTVLNEYEKVLKVNPGNIAALTAQGNILWLIRELTRARRKFDEGCNLKMVVSDTSIAQLIYGKARVLAEEGKLDQSYDLYNQAVATNPNVGVYSMINEQGITVSFYDYITNDLVDRYRDFYEAVTAHKKEKSIVYTKVLSYALNDFANACINYYTRYGNEEFLKKSLELYSQSIELYPSNIVAKYNRSNALNFLSKPEENDDPVSLLKEVTDSNPRWFEALSTTLERIQQECYRKIREASLELSTLRKKLAELSPASMLKAKPGMASSLTSSSFQGSPGTGYTPAGMVPGQSTPSERRQLEDKIAVWETEIRSQEERLNNLNPLIRKVFEKSRLISLYDGLRLGSFNARAVRDFIRMKIDWIRLDQEDVRALRNYAISFYYNIPHDVDFSEDSHSDKGRSGPQHASRLLVCKELINHLRRYYYPDDFALLRILLELLQRTNEDKLSYEHLVFCRKFKSPVFRRLQGNRLPDELWQTFADLELLVREPVLTPEVGNSAWLLHVKSDKKMYNFRLIRSGNKLSAYSDELAACKSSIETSVRFWIQEDPAHWNILNLVKKYMSPGEYQELLENAAKHVSNPLLCFMLSENLFDQGRYEEAKEGFVNTLKLDETKPIYHYKLGETCGKLNEWEAMAIHIGNAVVRRSGKTDDTNTLFYYLDALLSAHIRNESQETFVQFLESYGSMVESEEKQALLQNKTGIAFSDLGNWNKAMEYFRAAATLDPSRPIYICNLALMYSNVRDTAKAAELYKRAIDLRKVLATDDYSLEYYYGQYARVYYLVGAEEEFLTMAEQSGDFTENDASLANLANGIGVMFSMDNQYENAIPYFSRAILLDPSKPIYTSNLALMYANILQWDKAKEEYCKVLDMEEKFESDSYGTDYYFSLGVDAFFQTGEIEHFLSLVEKSPGLTSHPDLKAVVYNRIGNLYSGVKDTAQAISWFEKSISLDPSKPIYHCNLGYIRSLLNDWENAWGAYSMAITLRRGNPQDSYGYDYYTGLAVDSYFHTGRIEEFFDLPEMKESKYISSTYKAIINNQVGNLYSQASHPYKAIPFYKKAIELDDSLPIYHCNLALMYENTLQWDFAVDNYKNAVLKRRISSDDKYEFDYYYRIYANACYNAGSMSEFLRFLEKSKDFENIPEKLAIVYNQLGNLHNNDQLYEEAIPFYESAIRFDPSAPVYYSNIGIMNASMGEWEKAREYHMKAIEKRRKKEDDYPFDYYYNLLGEASLHSGHIKEFLALIDRTKDLKDDPIIKAKLLRDLGDQLTSDNKPEDANSFYSRAVRLDPSNEP